MSESFNVLKCFKCDVFQVHLTKKSNKWQCKLCGEKQSLMKVYGNGSAFDCRKHAQKLNLISGQQERSKESLLLEEIEAERSKSSDSDTFKAISANFEKTDETYQTRKKFRSDDQRNARVCPNEARTEGERPKTGFPSIRNTPITSKWLKYLDTDEAT